MIRGRIRRGAAKRRAVVAAARRLADLGLLVATTGNVSVRRGDDVIITPTRLPYDVMRSRDIVVTDLEGTVVSGRHQPSRELLMHLALYHARPDVGAVVHTHSPHATAWSFVDQPLTGSAGSRRPPSTEEISYYDIGAIPTSAAAPAGSPALARNAVRALGRGRAALLANHGVLATGDTLTDAVQVAESVEHQARVAWLVQMLEHRASQFAAGDCAA